MTKKDYESYESGNTVDNINTEQKSRNRVYVADCYYNIGLVYFAANQKKMASKWLDKALQVYISETGEMNIGVAKIYEVLAVVYDSMKLTHDAIQRLKRCIEIRKHVYLDPKHPELLSVLNKMKFMLKRFSLQKKEERQRE